MTLNVSGPRKPMTYLSVCSGIEAATVAWHPLGWRPFGFSEIEAFPSAVLAHHYGSNMPGEAPARNGVPNFGDMTKFEEWPDADVDVLVGGTPCQDYSIAGLRAGMDGIRGSLTLTYAAIARRYRTKWLAWENVPGVLSINDGRDFAGFLGLLAGRRIEVPQGGWQSAGIIPGYERAYGLAWRVLDAQFIRVDGFARAVPQRRRRVFVVGYFGDWRRAAAVLFERESLSGHRPPRREAGQRIAPTISSRPTGGGGLGTDFDCDGGLIASTVSSKWSKGSGGPAGDECQNLIAIQERAVSENAANGPDGIGIRTDGVAYTMEARSVPQAVAFQPRFARNDRGAPDVIASALTGEAGRTGKGDSAQCVAYSITPSNSNEDYNARVVDKAQALTAAGNRPSARGGDLIAFAQNSRDEVRVFGGDGSVVGALAAEPGMKQTTYLASIWAVRRLMPIECERLQGFPDGYTDVPYRNKPAADGPRYKALGNSMAVNVMRWIGMRIDLVRAIKDEAA